MKTLISLKGDNTMQDLNELLGKQSQNKNPLEATPQSDVASPEENPLEAMDKISKQKPDGKKTSSDKKLDPNILEEMLMTGENNEGDLFEPDKKDSEDEPAKIKEDVDKDAERKLDKGKVTPSDKYAKNFKNDLLKHPNDYKVSTPEGEMTIAEAMKRGYNPITKQFEERHDPSKIKESFLGELNDTDRTNIERITNPEAAQIAPADAEKYGLTPDSPMVRPNQPAPLPGMPQGIHEQGMAPAEQPIPQEGQPQGNPLESLLGGR